MEETKLAMSHLQNNQNEQTIREDETKTNGNSNKVIDRESDKSDGETEPTS